MAFSWAVSPASLPSRTPAATAASDAWPSFPPHALALRARVLPPLGVAVDVRRERVLVLDQDDGQNPAHALPPPVDYGRIITLSSDVVAGRAALCDR